MKSSFDNPSGNFSLEKLQQIKNLPFLSPKIPKIVPFDTYNEVLTTMLKNYCHSQLSFRSKSKKCEPKKDFKLIYFPWKRWSGHAESCFEKPATFFRKNSISFRSTLEEVGKVLNSFERAFFLQNAAFDTKKL